MPDRDVRRPGWRSLLPRTPRYLGRRGGMLLTLGTCWIIIGLGIIDSPAGDINLLHTRLPVTVRVALWIGTGAVAILYAWRPPGMHDAPGYAALYLMPAWRVLSYTLAWIDSLAPLGGDGLADGWRFAAAYAAMLSAVIVSAGWPEPPHPHRHLLQDSDDDEDQVVA